MNAPRARVYQQLTELLRPMTEKALDKYAVNLDEISYEVGLAVMPGPQGTQAGLLLLVRARGMDLTGPGRYVMAMSVIGDVDQDAADRAVIECCNNLRQQKAAQGNGQAPQ